MDRHGVAAGIVAAGGTGGAVAWALQSPIDGNGVIHGCYNPSSGALKLDVVGKCPAKGMTTPITWNAQGPKGDPGQQGVPGPPGQTSEFALRRGFGSDVQTVVTLNGVSVGLDCEPGGVNLVAFTNSTAQSLTVRGFAHSGDIGEQVESSRFPAPGGGTFVQYAPQSNTPVLPGTFEGTAVLQGPTSFHSAPETGMWLSFVLEPDQTGCDITGVAAPIDGTRYFPLPIVVG